MAKQHLHQTHPDIIRRLKRAAGHLAGVIEMIEAGRSCLDLAQQLHAVESAIANAKRTLIHDHLDHCLDAPSARRRGPSAHRSTNSSRSRNTFEVAPMTPLSDLLQQGAAHAWLFIPSAILLGALHGLEPGHSKTMMAAFIIAVRGTVPQAVLLGLAATVSHTLVVWAVALVGLRYASQINPETTEPYFQVASAVLIVGVAVWMIGRTWREQRPVKLEAHSHDHGAETRRIDTGHGVVALEVFEDGVPPRWRIRTESGHGWPVSAVTVETVRTDGTRQDFTFVGRDDFLESTEEIPEPHEFTARLHLGHGDHIHSYDVAFTEHGHNHGHEGHGLDVTDATAHDAHQLAHANDIRRRFASQHVTTGQIVMFGLTGGLIPCPAAITVLLLCLQLRQVTLGVALVLCFSIGLALTMVISGVVAALSVQHVARRWSGFGAIAARAPYLSSALIICVGLYVGWQGVHALAAAGAI